MSVEVPSCNIRMIDSITFPPVALSELLIMFGLNELTKGYFQHLYNRTANQGIVMSHLPEMLYYNPDSMSADPSKASNRKLFLEWYDTHLNDTFAFNAELLKYCRSDVLSTVFLEIQRTFHGNYVWWMWRWHVIWSSGTKFFNRWQLGSFRLTVIDKRKSIP